MIDNPNPSKYQVAADMAKKLGYAESYIRSCIAYANAVNLLEVICPGIIPYLLTGLPRLSMERTIALAKMPHHKIMEILNLVKKRDVSALDMLPNRAELRNNSAKRSVTPVKRPVLSASKMQIKSTPAYDPEALVQSLVFTIPSWVRTMTRTAMGSDYNAISFAVRFDLRQNLLKLTEAAQHMLAIMEETDHEQ